MTVCFLMSTTSVRLRRQRFDFDTGLEDTAIDVAFERAPAALLQSRCHPRRDLGVQVRLEAVGQLLGGEVGIHMGLPLHITPVHENWPVTWC